MLLLLVLLVSKKIKEVERLNKLFIGREHHMIELKKEVNSLLEKMGQPKKYETTDYMEEQKPCNEEN